jgi:GNAT superfamily N-acetyltransferase
MPDSAPHKYANTLAFRPANPYTDARALIAFGRDLYIESLGNAAAFERDFGKGGERFPVWVASCAASSPDLAALLTEDGGAIGLVVLGRDRRDPRLGRVHHFYVIPSHRGRGFGGLLDDYARETLRRAGCARARLNVASGNARAIRFYAAQGWSEIARRASSVLRYMEVAL